MPITMSILSHTNQAAMFVVLAWWARVSMSIFTVSFNWTGLLVQSSLFGLPLVGYIHARLTSPEVRLARASVDIFFSKLMPVYAVSLLCVLSRRANSAQDINARSYVLNVDRINAWPNPTKVITMSPWGDNMNKHPKSNSVGSMSPPLELKCSVPVIVGVGRPKPTRNTFVSQGRIDPYLAEKANKKFKVYRNTVRIVLHGLAPLSDRSCLGFRGLQYREALSF